MVFFSGLSGSPFYLVDLVDLSVTKIIMCVAYINADLSTESKYILFIYISR